MIMLRMTVLTLCVLGSAFCVNVVREGSPEPRPKAIASETGSTIPKKGNSLRDLSVNDPTKTPERKPFKKGVGPSPVKAEVTPGGTRSMILSQIRRSESMEKQVMQDIVMSESVFRAIQDDYDQYVGCVGDFHARIQQRSVLKKYQLELDETNFWAARLVHCLDRVILEMPYRIQSCILCERTNQVQIGTISGSNKTRVLAHAVPYEFILKVLTSSMTKVFFIPLQQALDKRGNFMVDTFGNPKTEGPYVEFHYDVTLTAEQSPDSPLKCTLPNLGDCRAVIAFNESRNEHGVVVNHEVFDTLFHACFHTTDQQRLTRIPVRVEAGLAPGLAPRLAFKIQKQLVPLFPAIDEE